jgi:hypothetical protein
MKAEEKGLNNSNHHIYISIVCLALKLQRLLRTASSTNYKRLSGMQPYSSFGAHRPTQLRTVESLKSNAGGHTPFPPAEAPHMLRYMNSDNPLSNAPTIPWQCITKKMSARIRDKSLCTPPPSKGLVFMEEVGRAVEFQEVSFLLSAAIAYCKKSSSAMRAMPFNG